MVGQLFFLTRFAKLSTPGHLDAKSHRKEVFAYLIYTVVATDSH